MTGIDEVARSIGMSTATVSRALRGLPGVSEQTRRRVLAAAAELRYAASPHAASLASGRTRTVAVVVPFIDRWYFGCVLRGVGEVLSAGGFDLLVYSLDGSDAARHQVFGTALLRKRVDGVLVVSLVPEPDEVAALAFVRPRGWPPWARHVAGLAQRAGRRRRGRAHRHRAPARAGSPPDRAASAATVPDELAFTAPAAPARRATARRWPPRASLPRPGGSVPAAYTEAGGRRGDRDAARPARAPARPACVTGSDEMAFGALRALRERGLRVPADVSVVGIDDHDLAASQGLTTVAQDVREQGRVAARSLLVSLLVDDAPRDRCARRCGWSSGAPPDLRRHSRRCRPAASAGAALEVSPQVSRGERGGVHPHRRLDHDGPSCHAEVTHPRPRPARLPNPAVQPPRPQSHPGGPMAKALFGHVGTNADLRLLADLRRAHRRIAELEDELARTRATNEALVGNLRVQDAYADDVIRIDEPALT